MKVYILVEGKETEPLFYPALFNYFLPNYTQCRELDQLSDDSYYIISGLGMPRTFQRIENCLRIFVIIIKITHRLLTYLWWFLIAIDIQV